jgi:hypothetical protein
MEHVQRQPGLQRRSDGALVVAAFAVAALSGPLALLPPSVAVALLGGTGLIIAVARHPPLATYLVLATTPLLAGIDRGRVVPLLRPNEAILALAAVGLGTRGMVALCRGRTWQPPRLAPVEWWLLALAMSGSVLPLLWMAGRGRSIASDDVYYAAYICKYAALYLIVRVSVRTEREARTCLWVSIATAVAVAIIAILQTRHLLGVPGLLASIYSRAEGSEALGGNRGTATLSSALAVGDVLIFNVALAAGWLARAGGPRYVLVGALFVLLLGSISTGQISTLLGLCVAAVTLGLVLRRLVQALLLTAVAFPLAALLVWPAVSGRIGDFGSPGGLPPSWIGPHGRLYNLETYFWPQLFTDHNWVTGVRVAARLPSTDPFSGGWVWIESGQTWLLWSGGVLLLMACFGFLATAIKTVARVARSRTDVVGVAAVGALVALWVNVALMTFDVHLTLRGSAELTFTLLALALLAVHEPRHGDSAPYSRSREGRTVVSAGPNGRRDGGP